MICASQGGGKSHLVKHIVHKLRKKVSYGVVFSQTAFNQGNFDYIPRSYIHSRYKPEVLEKLLQLQSKQKEEDRKLAFVILDDCLYDSWTKCKLFNQMMTQVRHFNIICIITTQYINKIPSQMREQCFSAIFNVLIELSNFFFGTTKRMTENCHSK